MHHNAMYAADRHGFLFDQLLFNLSNHGGKIQKNKEGEPSVSSAFGVHVMEHPSSITAPLKLVRLENK